MRYSDQAICNAFQVCLIDFSSHIDTKMATVLAVLCNMLMAQ